MKHINRNKFQNLETFIPDVALGSSSSSSIAESDPDTGNKPAPSCPLADETDKPIDHVEYGNQSNDLEFFNVSPHVGMLLGKCRLVQLLGKGASALVFKGEHETLKIPVAVKVILLKNMIDKEKVKKQFCLEARTLAKLNHPYIVRILDYDERPFPYIILEYIDGDSLDGLIKQYGKIDSKTAAYYIYRAGVALIVAHENGIVHRDIKPANILVTKDGRAKLTDLGVSYCATNFQYSQDKLKPKSFKGTPAYVAPEQVFEPNGGDPRSDIYSLGATFYHTVTGRYPFVSNSFYSAVMSHATEPLQPPHKVTDLPLEVSNCIQKMMAKDPEDRFQSVEELLPELIGFFSDVHHPEEEGSIVCDAVEPITSLTGTITSILIRAAASSSGPTRPTVQGVLK